LAGAQPASVRGTLVHQELLGAETLLHVGLRDDDAVLIARVEPERARGLALGATLLLSTQRVLVFDAQGRRLRDVQWLPQRHLEVVNG
ncbi:MAG: TOBE domain-containing protein, partial [Aquabacterium sp.]|nr:TOBE domain-containing protein [Aquabacterium sp.]